MSRVYSSSIAVVVGAVFLVCQIGHGEERVVGTYRPMHSNPRSNMCGIKCLCALHRYMGDRVTTTAQIAEECGWSWGQEMNLLNIRDYVAKYRFDYSAVCISAAEVSGVNVYLIPVRVAGSDKYNHLYMIAHREGDDVVYFDGDKEMKHTTVKELEKMWHGECIMIKKRMQPPAVDRVKGLEFVHIDCAEPFYVSKCEVTIGQYKTFLQSMRSGEYAHDFCYERKCERDHAIGTHISSTRGGKCPVADISWYDAYAFCKWLGPEYQLPSRVHYQNMVASPMAKPSIVQQFASGDPVPTDQNTEANGRGIVGLFSSVREYTIDNTADMASGPKNQVYIFESDVNRQAFAFHFLTPKGRDKTLGFRIVKVR